MVQWEKARPQYFTSPVLGTDKSSSADDFPRHWSTARLCAGGLCSVRLL